MMDDSKPNESAQISLVVEHYVNELREMDQSKLQAKHLAKKKEIMRKLHAMKAMDVVDPKVLLEIYRRVGYKLPEFDIE